MNTDPSASRPQPDLQAIAANPNTDLEVLRTLAYEYPHLRPVVALNPSAYEGLLQWLGTLGDEGVNAALLQRQQSGPVYPSFDAREGVPASAGVDGDAGSVDAAGEGEGEPAADEATPEGAVLAASAGEGGAESDAGDVAAGEGEGVPYGQDANAASEPTEVISAVPPTYQPAGSAEQSRSNFDAAGYGAAAGAAGAAGYGAYNVAQGAGGAYAGAQGQQEPQKRSALVPLVIVLAIVAVVLAGFAIFFATRSPSDTAQIETQTEPMQTEATEAPETEATTEEPTTEEPTTEAEKLYPAPNGSPERTGIAAPSGNIVCELSDDAVTCTVLETNDDYLGSRKCDDGSVTLQATADSVGLQCGAKVGTSGRAVAEYGEFAQSENFACASHYNGISCWNQVTGQGFAVSRQGWTSSSRGPIEEESYPWYSE
ncbi:MAG: hypothetical protein Q4D87_04670 [Actinomycetaceae bacterium]|nr:hypothetical protein [Actinomycetaceae bacterium]